MHDFKCADTSALAKTLEAVLQERPAEQFCCELLGIVKTGLTDNQYQLIQRVINLTLADRRAIPSKI